MRAALSGFLQRWQPWGWTAYIKMPEQKNKEYISDNASI